MELLGAEGLQLALHDCLGGAESPRHRKSQGPWVGLWDYYSSLLALSLMLETDLLTFNPDS